MSNKARLIESLAVAGFFAALNCVNFAQSVDSINSTTEKAKRSVSGSFPTLYWAVPRPIADTNWHAVFGGTVVSVKKEKQELSEDLSRKIVTGEIKIEKIFLNLPDGKPISINDQFFGEGFENLKKGDKVIVFINGFYEKEFVRIAIDGTNSALGLKVKDWNEPIVSVLEKIAPCSEIKETTPEGHKKDFLVKLYDCRAERDKMILENALIWKRYDPKGVAELIEKRKFEEEN